MRELKRFIHTTDLHWGYERRQGRKLPMHDPKAWGAVMAFAQHFKPHHWVMGGDILDCGAISHHNHNKPRRTEGFRLQRDAEECVTQVLRPAEAAIVAGGSRHFIIGNHCDWVEDLLDKDPALEGLVSIPSLLKLDNWTVIPQGGYCRLGKLHFIHGDQISGGANAAKNAVEAYGENIRLGHFHTHMTHTKTSAIDSKLAKTGVVVPCLCTKDPKYNEGKPNRWVQGFGWGYILPDGTFSDYVSIIIDGKFAADGKVFKG